MSGLRDDYGMFQMRQLNPQDQFLQNILGPIEHQQFVREVTAQDPVQGLAVLSGAPLYSGLKALGLNVDDDKSAKTSEASWDELFRAWDGFNEGMSLWMSNNLK